MAQGTHGKDYSAIVLAGKEVVTASTRCEEQRASLGDFSPQILTCLGSGPQRQIWAVARLRNRTDPHPGSSEARGSMSPRVSFSLAWLVLSQGLRSMRF